MKLALVCAFLAVTAAFAENTTNYYIERYPGDGMKQRPRVESEKKKGIGFDMQDLSEIGVSSTNAVTTGTNTSARAARYTSPRVGSKDFAPSRIPEPKTKTVAVPTFDKKLPPSPRVNDKTGAMDIPTKAATTNAPTAAFEPPK